MVDNFELIKSLLKFDSEDNFYFLQLIKRKKEHEELGSNNVVVCTYYITSLAKLDTLESEIKAICSVTNSRAYINLNRRSFEKLAYHHMQNVCDHIMNRDFIHIHRSFNTVCGKYRDDPDPSFLLDIDGEGEKRKKNEILLFIERECEPIGNKFKAVIPTKNGIHLIVKPFNVKQFADKYPDISVHKNNPTILYIP